MKNLTWQQALVFVACLAAPVFAYKFLASPEAAGVAGLVGMVVNFMMGRSSGGDPPSPPPPTPPTLPPIAAAVIAALCLAACSSLTPADYAQIGDNTTKIVNCQTVGRLCQADGGTDCYSKYDACMKDAGLR